MVGVLGTYGPGKMGDVAAFSLATDGSGDYTYGAYYGPGVCCVPYADGAARSVCRTDGALLMAPCAWTGSV